MTFYSLKAFTHHSGGEGEGGKEKEKLNAADKLFCLKGEKVSGKMVFEITRRVCNSCFGISKCKKLHIPLLKQIRNQNK